MHVFVLYFVWHCTRDSTLPTAVCILIHGMTEAECFVKGNFRQHLF